MRRALVFITLLLLGGAIVNVAVAWGLSFQSRPTAQAFVDPSYIPNAATLRWWRHYAPPNFPEPMVVNRTEGGGFRLWAGYDMSVKYFGYGRAHGWPMLALERQNWVTRAQTDQYRALHLTFWPWSPQRPRELPIVPVWPGFAINTVMYAAILWLCAITARHTRRRIRLRRGLCPACAYPMGASAICTECGKMLPPSSVHPS